MFLKESSWLIKNDPESRKIAPSLSPCWTQRSRTHRALLCETLFQMDQY